MFKKPFLFQTLGRIKKYKYQRLNIPFYYIKNHMLLHPSHGSGLLLSKPQGIIKKALLTALLVFFIPFTLSASFMEEIDFSGYLEKREARQVKESNDLLASEILFRSELRKANDNTLLFASFDFMENEFIDENSKLHEAYIDYSFKNMTFKCGRQIIIKGNSDALRINDIISPVDSSEFVTRSFDETRMAVDALNFSYNEINYSINLLYIPVFDPAVNPDKESPWYIKNRLSDLEIIKIEPDNSLSNSEAGAEVKFFLPGFDFSFSYFRGFSDNPVTMLKNKGNENYLYQQYKREDIFGASFSKPHKDFVFRGETAYFKGIYLNNKNLTLSPVKTDLIKWIAATDYYPGNNLTLSIQFYGENILSHSDKTAQKDSINILTISASKKLFREKLSLSSMLFFNTDKNDSYLRLSSDYELTNQLKIYAGSDIFSGSKDTGYGRYRDNTQFWLRLKYSF